MKDLIILSCNESFLFKITNNNKCIKDCELERLLRKMCRKYICEKIEHGVIYDMDKDFLKLLGKERILKRI